MTRRNDRTLRTGTGSWVKNGDRWRVVEVHPDGATLVERHDRSRPGAPGRLALPSGYVGEHVQLGYASTIHGAQGATVDTTHTVLTGTESRQALYVALSRGRQTNHLYLAAPTASLDDVGLEVRDEAVEPQQVLTDILARDGRALSATTVERGDATQLLREAVLAYQDALPVLAQQHLGHERMAHLDDALERWLPGLTATPTYPYLRGQLALRWIDGTPPQKVVEVATWYRGTQSLTEADDPAAVLTWRIAGTTPPSYRDAPLPWLPNVPSALRQDAETSDYLDRLTQRIDDLKQRVADEARQAGKAKGVPWQRTLPADVDDHLLGDLAIWRAAHGIRPTEPRPTGPPTREPSLARHGTRLIRRLSTPSVESIAPVPTSPSERLRTSHRAAERHLDLSRPVREPAPRW